MNAEAGKLFTDGDRGDATHVVTTGILPDRDIAKLIEGGRISAEGGVDPSQIQPASLDLRLGATAWRVRASFLPGKSSTVQAKIDRLKMHQIDLTKPTVLEKGCVYIAELMEELKREGFALRQAETLQKRVPALRLEEKKEVGPEEAAPRPWPREAG